MLTFLNSERFKPATLLPFLYTGATRIEAMRDLAYVAASSWLPGIWIVYRLGEVDFASAVLLYAIGFYAFIAIYEIGYLVNDGWDAHRSEGGRTRLRFKLTASYVAGFVALRIGVWAAIGIAMGWIENVVWLSGFAALVFAFALHNMLLQRALRSASFFQLATLRFSLPMLGSIATGDVLLVLVCAVVFYTYFRFLAYLDSKELLNMSVRRENKFGISQVVFLSPLVALIAVATGSWLPVELLVYFASLYGAYALVGWR